MGPPRKARLSGCPRLTPGSLVFESFPSCDWQWLVLPAEQGEGRRSTYFGVSCQLLVCGLGLVCSEFHSLSTTYNYNIRATRRLTIKILTHCAIGLLPIIALWP